MRTNRWTLAGAVLALGMLVACETVRAPDVLRNPPTEDIPTQQSFTWTESRLVASDGNRGDSFSRSVAIDENVAVIGAPLADDRGPQSGAVYVFRWSGTAWVEEDKLIAEDGVAGDTFGDSVAIDGDTIVIGAPRDDSPYTDAGSAYVFRRGMSGWTQHSKLLPSDGLPRDAFGSSVAVEGDSILVGAPDRREVGPRSGVVYAFTMNGDGWSAEKKLVSSDLSPGDRFGFALSVDRATAVIGSYWDDDAGTNSGSAYVFSRKDGSWSEQAKLVATDAYEGDNFGFSVGIDGDLALVGAPSKDVTTGAAYLFERRGSSWAPLAKILAGDKSRRDLFGISVAVDGTVVAVGAPGVDDAGRLSGAAYVFTPEDEVWTERMRLIARDAAPESQFGLPVAVYGETILIGARGSDGIVGDSGAAYVFRSLGNRPPEVERGLEFRGPEGTWIQLDASTTTDPDGDPLTFAWDLDDDGAFETPGVAPTFAAVDGPASLTVHVEACDPAGLCATAPAVVTVANVAPTVDAGPDQTVYRNDEVTLSGAFSDPAGSADAPYGWSWSTSDSGSAAYGEALPGSTTFAIEGSYPVTLVVTDDDGASSQDELVVEVLNRAPVCTDVVPSQDVLWPPNHELVAVGLSGATDAEGDTLTYVITGIRQDEPVTAAGDGNSEVDGEGVGTSTAWVRAERSGSKKVPGDGRVYHIGFAVDDGHGGTCEGTVLVGVPHDRKGVPVDGGPLYDSTLP